MKTLVASLCSLPTPSKLETPSMPFLASSHPRSQLHTLAVVSQHRKNSSAKRSSKPSKTPLPTPTTSTNVNGNPPLSKKVLVPIGFGTEEMEAVIMVDVLRRAGAEVTVASVEQQLEVEASGGTRLVADALIADCSCEVYDLIALPGGMPGSARLRDCEILQNMTKKQAEEKRLYGAICAAPAVTLLPWGLLRRKQMTCHPAFNDKLPTFWAVKSNNHVHGELTTSRGPGTSFDFAISLVNQLFGEIHAKEVGDSVLLDDANDGRRKEELNEALWSLNRTPKVLLPVANGCEGIEVVTIVDILRRARANVVVASVEKSTQILLSQGLTIVADKLIPTATEATYDLIILPGGMDGLERLHKSRVLKKLLKQHHIGGRIFGAMNSSLPILQRQGLLKDKEATANNLVTSNISDIVNSSGVVIDGKLITSKGLATATDFGLAIVSKFFGQARARSVAEAVAMDKYRGLRPRNNRLFSAEEIFQIGGKKKPSILED